MTTKMRDPHQYGARLLPAMLLAAVLVVLNARSSSEVPTFPTYAVQYVIELDTDLFCAFVRLETGETFIGGCGQEYELPLKGFRTLLPLR